MYFLYIFFCFCFSTFATLISCLFICLSLILRALNLFVIVFFFCFDVILLVFYLDSVQTYFSHRAQAIYIICHILTAYNQLASSLKFIFTTAIKITAVQPKRYYHQTIEQRSGSLYFVRFYLNTKIDNNVITVASLNVRGLRNSAKRRDIFNWLRSKKLAIYLLQETHCSEEMSHFWAAEWGYKSLFSTFSSNKAGVGILFNNNFDLQIMKSYIDSSGRYIICEFKSNGKFITLANVYAPNEDDPTFFKALSDHLLDFQDNEIILGGDFNLVLDIEKDKQGGLAKAHQNAKNTVCNICENLDLVDAWRILNQEARRYTWRRSRPEIHCRLDFFLVSQSLLDIVSSADILPGFKTDHSLITLNISLHSNPRGRGFWKLITSLLVDADYIDLIKRTIRQTKQEYENDEMMNPALLWT